jgi:hypothetical protein
MLSMSLDKGKFSALVLFTALAGGTTFFPLSSATASDEQRLPGHEQRVGDHIEGHIAFLKAELNINPAQETLWAKVAATMRADVTEFETLRPRKLENMSSHPTAIERLEERAQRTALRAKSEQQFLDAFRPLYETFSDSQKRSADELLGQRHEAP